MDASRANASLINRRVNIFLSLPSFRLREKFFLFHDFGRNNSIGIEIEGKMIRGRRIDFQSGKFYTRKLARASINNGVNGNSFI